MEKFKFDWLGFPVFVGSILIIIYNTVSLMSSSLRSPPPTEIKWLYIITTICTLTLFLLISNYADKYKKARDKKEAELEREVEIGAYMYVFGERTGGIPSAIKDIVKFKSHKDAAHYGDCETDPTTCGKCMYDKLMKGVVEIKETVAKETIETKSTLIY